MTIDCVLSGNDAERDRLAALSILEILDTPPEREFDDLTRLAASVLGVASAAISLIDDKRQWFKARHGISFPETAREIAFCSHAVASQSLLVVPDARQDIRFRTNPLVTQVAGIRFYAGAPLIVQSGHCLGTLCVFDPAPRERLTDAQQASLIDLARMASDLIESRRLRRMGEVAAKVIEATSDAVIAADLSGRIVYWNPAAERMFGRSAGEALGQDVDIIMPARLAVVHRDIFTRTTKGAATRLLGSSIEFLGVHADGQEFPIELSLARWGEGGTGEGFAAIVRDISVRRAAEQEREQSKAFLDSVIRNLPAMLFVKDARTREYLIVNEAGERVMGRPVSEVIGRTDAELFPEYAEGFGQRDNEALSAAAPTTFESQFILNTGETAHLRTVRAVIDGPERERQFILGISEDVTQTRLAQAEVLRLAHYDGLTGLLNRTSHTDRLHSLVTAKSRFAMLSIDLNRFKSVIDQYGHPAADEVLSDVSDRLRALITVDDWLARIGGDEFVIVLTGSRLSERAQKVAENVVASLIDPVSTQRGLVHASASVGGVLFPEDGQTTEQLRENADLALFRAKQQGLGTICFFNADMDTAARDRRRVEMDLREAVAEQQITLHYQPLVSAKTGRVTSAEALARWNHPKRGPVRPDVFISVAEECGLIDALGTQLLRAACTEATNWPKDIRVAVNLSPLQFLSGRLVETIDQVLSDTGLAPGRLQLEVTEGLVIKDVERTFQQLEQLRSLGIQILIDDFGVGYSSLSYFKRFPFDKVKIDKSFVDDIATSKAAKAIVQAVIGLGEQLGMGIVAEGVESKLQMQLLTELGCTHLQGYLFSRPMPPEAFRQLLATETSHYAPRNIYAA